MCLAVPAKVVSIDEDAFFAGEVDILGNKKTVSLILTPDAKIGDWVLVHAGQAISIISEDEAQASLEVWEDILHDEN